MPRQPWLERNAQRHPERVALEAGEERLTYRELRARAAAAAAELGVAPGERLALALPAGLDLAVWLHACLLAGAVAVPVDPGLTAAERAPRVRGVARVVDGPPPAPAARGSETGPAPGWEPSDVALVVHTSGTTAEPVPVALTLGNVEANAVGSALALGLDAEERWLCPLPLTHVGGLMVLLRSLVYATTAVLAPPPFDPGRVHAALEDASLVSLVPTMLARLLDAGLDARPPRLRAVLLGGAPAGPALLARAAAAGLPVAQTYGLTQACSQVTVSTPGEPETAGWPVHGVDVAVAEDGEIVVCGPTVAGGGELRTGDLGRLDARGRLTVIGRKADTIVTGGENVAPAEVEAVLLAHPGVREAAVFARPHPEWGEAVTAKVVGEADPEALRVWAAGRLAGYKVPKSVERVEALPRTASGKLLRRELG